MAQDPQIASILSVPFAENTYVVAKPAGTECFVVDPGLEPAKILRYLDESGLTLVAILCTHGHSDHIGGNYALKQKWPECPLIIGHEDEKKLSDPVLNLSAGFGVELVSPPADITVAEGDHFESAGFKLDVLETPGHSFGHVVFVDRQSAPVRVYGGDVLFQRGIGRTDFPDGDFEQLRASIHDKLFPLPDDTIIYPGHGPTTTIGEEKRENPFVGAAAGYAV